MGAIDRQFRLYPSFGTAGQWGYQAFVRNGSREAESDASKFTAVESTRHGWIRPSKKNPHYVARDDGTSYYGVGAYMPWGAIAN
jgi:hypothetical protein